jgi:hypothetical protein
MFRQCDLTKDREHELHRIRWIGTTGRRRNPHAYPRNPSHDYAEVVRNPSTPQNITGER